MRTLLIMPRRIIALFLGTAFLFAVDSQAKPQPGSNTDAWVDVSSSLGFPLGGIGTGYLAFGKYGFVRVNFDGRPKDGLNAGEWEYTAEDAHRNDADFAKAERQLAAATNSATPTPPKVLARLQKTFKEAADWRARVTAPEGFEQSTFGFTITDGADSYVLQTTPTKWKPDALPFAGASVAAYLPKGRAVFTDDDAKLRVTVLGFVPMLPHDLRNSTLPVQVFDVTVANTGNTPRQLVLALENSAAGQATRDRVIFKSATGEMVFAAQDGESTHNSVSIKVDLPPGGELTQRFVIAWHYPKIDNQSRYYNKAGKNASEFVDKAMHDASSWSERIDAWHNSIQAPAYLKRLWFGSLASIMTSTFMTDAPYFFEIETPHPSLNTMDVCIYSGWVYLVNWPELERMDMNQFFKATPTNGPKAGLIMHSLWQDSAKYVEEPAFIARVRRDALWFNDAAWTRTGFYYATLAANRVSGEGVYHNLVESKHGNQSYDVWKMPGVSSYVNSAWVYGLDALRSMAASLGETNVTVSGESVSELLPKALASYDRLLWNPQSRSYNLFYRTEGADNASTPESLFTDQLFGRWVSAIDVAAINVLPADKMSLALQTLYTNNLVEDKAQGFRGWVNGMKPGRAPDVDTGYHARTCWFGAQLNFASLLGFVGDEAKSLDVMRSIDASLKNNHLAAGEWNRSINSQGEVLGLSEEICKDTPRFAPYPRYKSSWEYLVRMLGLQMDEQSLYFRPFKTVDFHFTDLQLAGMKLDITVESDWNHVFVDSRETKLPLIIPRIQNSAKVEFLK